jgi:DNA repair photolyase
VAAVDVRYHEKPVKQALKRENLSGTFVTAKYRFSPYSACEHGCLYCDGRAEKYYVEGEFERDIIIRPNLPELLEAELPKLREKGTISIGSGVSDAYQPAERETGLMRRCAEVLARYPYPVTMLTKSSLIMRDLDVWKKVNEKSGFMLAVSLTFVDDTLRQIFEPGASPVEERWKMLRAFKEAGCSIAVLAMPLLPFLTDTSDHVAALYEKAAELGPLFIMPGGLTLRPGRQKDSYLTALRTRFPHLITPTEEIYRQDRPSGAAAFEYQKGLFTRLSSINRKYNLPYLVPHRYYRDKVHLYDEINILLHHMAELYGERGIDTRPLKRATKAYLSWIREKKSPYNRHRTWDYADLEDEVREAFRIGEIAEILRNDKLTDFLKAVVLDRNVFDYIELKLV